MHFGNLAKQDYDDKMDESWGNAANDPWAGLNIRSNIASPHRTYNPAQSASPCHATHPSAQRCKMSLTHNRPPLQAQGKA